MPAAEHAKTKWTQVTALEGMLGDIQEAEVSTMLNLFQLAGHYTSQHGPFHELRDALQRDQVCGPNGEPLPLPPVGNWILALGVSLLGLDTPAGQELFSRITNHQTAGDLVEAWSLQLWERVSSVAKVAASADLFGGGAGGDARGSASIDPVGDWVGESGHPGPLPISTRLRASSNAGGRVLHSTRVGTMRKSRCSCQGRGRSRGRSGR